MGGTGVRASAEKLATAAIIGAAAFTFTTTVNFLPVAPFLPFLVAAILTIVAAYRDPVIPAGVLSFIVFATIIYQLTGFTVWEARNPVGVILIVAVSAALLVTLLSVIREASSIAIALLAVVVMFTPYYFVSVALITTAAVSSPEKKMWPMVAIFILILGPLLVMENSLAPPSDSGPIIFAQLTNLGANMRPPLASMNIFLPNPTATDYLNPETAARVLSYFVNGQVYQLLIPLSILAIVFSLTAVAADAVNSFLRRLAITITRGRLIRRITPVLVSFVAPIAFTIMIIVFGHRGIGGYRTSLDRWDVAGLIIASLALGAIYMGKDYTITILEKTELARIRLRISLEKLLKSTAENTRLIAYIREKAPSIDLVQESNINHEAESAVKELDSGIEALNRRALEQWAGDLDSLTLRVEGLPESLRFKIVSGVNALARCVETLGEELRGEGVESPFNPSITSTSTIEEAIASYTRVAADTRRGATRLLDVFLAAQAAYYKLTARPGGSIPVDPMTLFDSHNEQAGLRLIAEEYVLKFQNQSRVELKTGLAALNDALNRFRKMGGRIESGLMQTFETGGPMDSAAILEAIEALRMGIDETLQSVEDENKRFRDYIDSLTPGAWELIGVDSPGGRLRLGQVRDMNADLPHTIVDTVTLLDEATILLRNRAEELRRNEEAVIIAVQYPYAKRIIESRLMEGGEVRLGDLPYASAPAHLYAHLYARGNPGTRYDPEQEVITHG